MRLRLTFYLEHDHPNPMTGEGLRTDTFDVGPALPAETDLDAVDLERDFGMTVDQLKETIAHEYGPVGGVTEFEIVR